MINRRIRNFEIKELIATGGMAAIYKANQVTLDRIVAVKVLHGHPSQDKDFIIRFEREAKAAANLQHENIVNIIDFGQEEEVYFIAMEYVDGKSLKDILNQVKFIPQEIALGIVLEIGKGLGYAHQKGIVHRDIKPANILIGYDGIVKIADFGLAQAQDLTTITVTGAIVGTPAYMSPEQAAGKKVDNRSDIFSLGVVFYEMLTGVKPFKGENYSSVIHEILTINPIKAFEANPLIAKELSTVIERMLEKDPDKRYQNIEEVSEDIIIQMKRTRTEINRKDIGDFISKPEEKLKNLMEKRKERHFERGIYFMNSGYEKIDDAIAEFEKVLLLDPNDARAKNYLETLKTKRAKIPSQKKIKEKKPAKKSPIFIGMLAGLIAIAIIIYFILNSFFRVMSSKELTGMAVVNTVPPGAEIFFDNDSTGMITPATLKGLTIGEHQLELKKNGYKPFVQKIEIKGNDTLKLDITLLTEIAKEDTANIIKPPVPKKQSPPIQGMGYLKVKVEPWARIYIDGKYVETTPIARSLPVSSGVHSVRLENPNYKVWQRNLRFNPGDTLNLNVRLELLEGALKLIVRPWADVYIDGKFYETTPIAQPIKLSAGEHRLKLINPLYKPYEEVIVIKPSQVLKKDVELEKK
uniref:non-specific serine/threonine protein kinase n=1 Tax=candidate division WOR-3 bacterium TaxID=2052148 RepID=A0A7C6AG00_UNCW3